MLTNNRLTKLQVGTSVCVCSFTSAGAGTDKRLPGQNADFKRHATLPWIQPGSVARLLQDLDALWTLPRLTHLSLLDNPVSKEQGYR